MSLVQLSRVEAAVCSLFPGISVMDPLLHSVHWFTDTMARAREKDTLSEIT